VGARPAPSEEEQADAGDAPQPSAAGAEFSAGAAGGENAPAIAPQTAGRDERVERVADEADAKRRLIERRRRLLEKYKAETGASNREIYEAREHSARKPAFYAWLKGDLPEDSATARNLERFLEAGKPPRRHKTGSE
jgi:hypothetical protein